MGHIQHIMECIPSNLSSRLHFGDTKLEHLSVSSGNVQLLPVQHGDGIENQYPLPSLAGSVQAPLQFPIPSLKLGSNDGSSQALLDYRSRRHAHKPRRGRAIDLERPYLVHPKYIEYRARPRQDLGKDKLPIWPDHIEAAFQDALVHIKPMGRKKCSQQGKPYGRNMLIAEWIYRATGARRERKQVSSHIQVLDRFLQGIPEWDRLMKPADDDEDGPSEGHKFYHNSIEHMVIEQQSKREDMAWDDDLDDADDSFMSVDSTSDFRLPHAVERLSFEMWVSSPADQDRVLHCYTGLKSEKMLSTPLEELPGWRLSFPQLKTLLDRRKRLQNCELILLNTSFKLMQEFPPRHSKLGIGLELTFSDAPKCGITSADSDAVKKWICTTYMYRDGVLISEPTREECQMSERWKVRPFFQSKWWAGTFTQLTEARKVAEDSKDPDAIHRASEHSRMFFRSLSIMQEVSAVPQALGWEMEPTTRSRVAILLWKFSEAPKDGAGTTTWQTLVAPPDRLTTNSPPPTGTDMDLPHLSMDSIVSPGNGTFHGNTHFLSQHGIQYDTFPDAMDEELCQDGFMNLKPEQVHDFSHLHSSFDMHSTHDFAGVDPSLHDTFNLAHSGMLLSAEKHSSDNSTLFERSSHTHAGAQVGLNSQSFDDVHDVVTHAAPDPPFSRFDRTTHQVLQEQLNVNNPGQDGSVSHSPSIKAEPSPQLSKSVADRTWSQQTDSDGRMLHLLEAQLQRRLAVQAAQEQQLAAQQRQGGSQTQMQGNSIWSPHNEGQDEVLGNALLAASAMNDLGDTAAHPPQSPQSQHDFNFQQQSLEDPHWISPAPYRPSLHSFHSFPGTRGDEHEHFHRLSFPHENNLGDRMPLSQPSVQLSGHMFMNHQLSALSAPEDFLHASTQPIEEGDPAAHFTRAHSEPDPSSAMGMTSGHEFPDEHDGNEGFDLDDTVVPEQQNDSQGSTTVLVEGMNLGDSFVEVSMEDVQDSI